MVFREFDFNNESDWHDILEQPFVNPPVIYKNIMTHLTRIIRALYLDTKDETPTQLPGYLATQQCAVTFILRSRDVYRFLKLSMHDLREIFRTTVRRSLKYLSSKQQFR